MEEIFSDNSRYYEIDWLNGVEIVKKLLKKRSERAITFEELKKEMKILEEIINKHNENEVEDLQKTSEEILVLFYFLNLIYF